MSSREEEDWLRDPSDRSRERWWDGTDWTADVRKNGKLAKDELTPEQFDALEKPERKSLRRRRATIESLAAMDKYRKPLREGELTSANVLGGSWNEYATVALTAMLLETLINVEAQLERLVDALGRDEGSDSIS